MKAILYPSKDRGHANHGWLDSYFSFSFSEYHDPKKIHFGALRVLNDDNISGGGGFGTHPHDNMEIITIPLEGKLAHKDSAGNQGIVSKGDVQIMSAGTGIRHSEYNASSVEAAKLLQIWVFPKVKDIKPVYGQKSFAITDRQNNWQVVVSPDTQDEALNINQDAKFSMVNLQAGKSIEYRMKWKNSGLYLFVIEGSVNTNDLSLSKRDAVGITEAEEIKVEAISNSEILAIEVPLNFAA